MKLYIIVILLAILKYNEAKFSTTKDKSKIPQKAIIAIQIIDPHENSTSTKNSKRTIESALGYGYQDGFGGKSNTARYEVYKYSQHDIPPFVPNQYTAQTSTYQVSEAVPKPASNPGLSNYYQPGTILFSTINQQGQLGELSTQFPGSLEDHHYPIPVIILRVHPDQLSDPLYPKLPQNHLHASTINSIDINSLLSNHIQENRIKQQQVVQQRPVFQPKPVYQQHYQEQYQGSEAYVPQNPSTQYQPEDYQTPDYQSQQYYPQQYQYEETQDASQNYHSPKETNQNYHAQQDVSSLPDPRTPNIGSYQYSNYQEVSPAYQHSSTSVDTYKSTELLTDENYPSEKHTQVIYKRSKGKSSTRNRHAQKSPQQVQYIKSHVSSQDIQPQIENVRQPSSNYFQPNTNYYTIQYSDDQGYTHQKAPRYRVKKRGDDIHGEQTRRYVYVSNDPMYNS